MSVQEPSQAVPVPLIEMVSPEAIDRRQVAALPLSIQRLDVTLEPPNGGMRSLSFSTGVGIVNEGPVQYRLDDVAYRMMDHAVTEGSGFDDAPL